MRETTLMGRIWRLFGNQREQQQHHLHGNSSIQDSGTMDPDNALQLPMAQVVVVADKNKKNKNNNNKNNVRNRRCCRSDDNDLAAAEEMESSSSSLPLLYYLAKRWAWIPLEHRCITHPHEVSTDHIDKITGDTILHWVVFGNPPFSVVKALLDVCPQLAQTPNYMGSLPLHGTYMYVCVYMLLPCFDHTVCVCVCGLSRNQELVSDTLSSICLPWMLFHVFFLKIPTKVACSYRASQEILFLLTDVYPEAAGLQHCSRIERDDDDTYVTTPLRSRYPLHIMCDYGHSDPKAFLALLRTKAGISTINKVDPLFGRTPLGVWNTSSSNLALYQHRRNRLRWMIPKEQEEVKKMKDNEKVQEKGYFSVKKRRTGTHDEEEIDMWNGNIQECVLMNEELEVYQQWNIWHIASLMIVADYEKTPIVDNYDVGDLEEGALLSPYRILRAAVANPNCPPSLQEYAVLVYFRSIMKQERDDDGRVILHWAMQYSNWDIVTTLLFICPNDAYIRDNHGNYPLVLALQNTILTLSSSSWCRGWNVLIEANPEAMTQVVQKIPHYLISWLLTRLATTATTPSTLFRIVQTIPTGLLFLGRRGPRKKLPG